LPHPAFAAKRLKFVRAKFFACGKRHRDSTSLTQRSAGPFPFAPTKVSWLLPKNTEVYT
jgi:hypothetical protein